MTWFANAEKRRAYRVAKFIKSRRVFVLDNGYGGTFEETVEQLEQNGYRAVKSKPRYVNNQ